MCYNIKGVKLTKHTERRLSKITEEFSRPCRHTNLWKFIGGMVAMVVKEEFTILNTEALTSPKRR